MKKTSEIDFFNNNFDLIRLLAACQVAHVHIFHVLNIRVGEIHAFIFHILGLFPGVPIFFFISGYLISKSWDSSRVLMKYTLNRVLRIYPALLFSVFFAVGLLLLSGYLNTTSFSVTHLLLVMLAKSTVLQFYNPDFLRGYGDGVLNGSLWTITVELQFYLVTPVYLTLVNRYFHQRFNQILLWSIAVFLGFAAIYTWWEAQDPGSTAFKLYRVSFLPWFYMFLCGVFAQRNHKVLLPLVAGRFLPILLVYLIVAYAGSEMGLGFSNNLNPFIFFLLIFVLLAGSYSKPDLANKTLRRNDLSYGIYIYHMPIINFLVYKGIGGDYWSAVMTSVLVLVISFFSWKCIEHPCIKLKRFYR